MSIDPTALDPTNVVELQLGDDELRQDFQRYVANSATRPPFYLVGGGGVQVICGRYAHAEEVFLERDRFSAEPPFGTSHDKFMGVQTLVQMDGDQHSRIRRLMNPAFVPSAVDALRPEVDAMVDRLLNDIEANGPHFDAMADFSARLMSTTLLRLMLRLDEYEQEVFTDMERGIWTITMLPPGVPFPPECIAAFDRARGLIEGLIADRRGRLDDDFLSRLLHARDDEGALTDKELFDQVFTVAVAAQNSTASSMGGTLLTLFQHPDQLDELRQDPDLVPQAVEECLRYHGPGLMSFPRFALHDTEVGGTKIAAGMPVRACFASANKDPDRFPDPLRFDIHRQPSGIMVFGAGAHHCIGHRLARMVLISALSKFLVRFPRASLADDSYRPVYEGSAAETMLSRLPVVTGR